MQKLKMGLLGTLLPLSLTAQNVGIGTNTPNASAKLEIADANRGILIPRVALTATNNGTTPIATTGASTSLLVYNTATAGTAPNDVTPGFYYWNGSSWVRFRTGAASEWALTGNAGTTPATNFIGTLDAQDFVSRTNNTERMRITSAGLLGIGTSAPSERLDVAGNVQNLQDMFTSVTFPAGFSIGDWVEFAEIIPASAQAGGNYEISISSTRGNWAGAATFKAMVSHANSYNVWRELGMVSSNPYSNLGHNFVVDVNPVAYATAAKLRVRAIGTIGDVSSACTVHIRVRSVNFTAGWTKTNVSGTGGTVAGYAKMTDEWNLFVGNSNNNSNANIAISAISNGNVGIGTKTPTAKLEVAGSVKIVDGTQGAGKVLVSDAAGLASWQDAPSDAGAADVLLGLNGGTATNLYSNYTTLTKGTYLVYFYNCVQSTSANYYLTATAEASSGTIAVPNGGFVWNFANNKPFTSAPFVLKVQSATASVRGALRHGAGGTISDVGYPTNCSTFQFVRIGN